METSSKKILIVLQCYHGDRAVAMENARLIADLEPEVSKEADFMFSFRWDTPSDDRTVLHVSQKFEKVYVFRSKRKSDGWPAGCNDLFFESMMTVFQNHRMGVWPYEVALFMEGDAVPLARDWIKQLKDEWYQKEQYALGTIAYPPEHPVAHMNGNCLMSPLMMRRFKRFHSCPPRVGWDVYHSRDILSVGRESRLIYNDYARPHITAEALFAPKFRPSGNPLHGQPIFPVLYHGVKGLTAHAAVRERVLNGVLA